MSGDHSASTSTTSTTTDPLVPFFEVVAETYEKGDTIIPETSSEDAMYCLKECFRDRLGGEVIVKA